MRCQARRNHLTSLAKFDDGPVSGMPGNGAMFGLVRGITGPALASENRVRMD